MEKYELEKLRDLPIEEVARQLGLEVNAHHKALCPFHDDHHASLSFSKRQNTCRCFVCMDRSLGTIDLVMKIKHVDFIVATRWLADQNGIALKGQRRGNYSYRGNGKENQSENSCNPRDSCSRPENPSNPRDSCSKPENPSNPRDSCSTPENPSNPRDSRSTTENQCNPCQKEYPCSPSFDASRYARFFEHPWLSDEARRFLFEERRIDPRVVRWCRISSWQDREGTHWLQTPYFDIEGKLIGIQNRNLDYKKSHTNRTDSSTNDVSEGEMSLNTNRTNRTNRTDSSTNDVSEGGLSLNTNRTNRTDSSTNDVSEGEMSLNTDRTDLTDSSTNDVSEGEMSLNTDRTDLTDSSKGKDSSKGMDSASQKPRFRFPYGAKCGIYNLPVIQRMKPGDELYITEGCSDCWAMLSAGHKAIAIPSATLLTPEDKQLLAELSQRLSIQWHMYPDRDAPGERLFLQLKQLLPSLQHHQLPPGCKDFGEAYVRELNSRE